MCVGRSRLLQCACLALVFFSVAGFLWADGSGAPVETPILRTPDETLMLLLKQADETCKLLEMRLKERKQEILNLQADLTQLSRDLVLVRSMLATSQADLTATLTLLENLETRYKQLVIEFEKYRQAMEAELNNASIRESIWRGIGLMGIGGAAGALIGDWEGAAYGALSGAIVAGVYELGHRLFKVW